MKKMKKNILIVLLILAIILFFSLKNEFSEVLKVLGTVNIWWFLVAILCLCCYLIFGALTFQKTVNALEEEHYSFFKSLRMITLGLFFNGITPSSSGGQPLQIYFMSKEGIDPRKGSSITIEYTILFQIALLLVAFSSLFLNYLFEFFPEIPVMKQLLIIGIVIHSMVVIILLAISFFPVISKSIIRFFIYLASKLKLVKNKENSMENITQYLDEFYVCAKELFNNRKLVIHGIICQVLSLCFFYSIPLFLMYSVGINDSMWLLPVLIGTSYVNVIGAFIPSPGGAGGFEYAFVKFFSFYLAGPILTTIMLLWRFVTYYLILLIGGFILAFYKVRDKESLLEDLPSDL